MIILNGTNETLELTTSAAVSTDYFASFADITTTTFAPDSSDGNIAVATTTTIVAAPATATQRQLKFLAITNRSTTTPQTVTLKYDIAATERVLFSTTLAAGEALHYNDGVGFRVYTKNGQEKAATLETSGYNGYPIGFYKVGSAPEAAGQWYCWAKDTGSPGAWAVGTAGVAGRATDGTAAGDAGCLPVKNPASGANYLTSFTAAATVISTPWLFDVVWVNNALVVTTTTAQTINSVAFPARDLNGSADGTGYWVGILVTTATTNAGAITNTTLSYTNEAGTAGRTATMASFPATAVAGTVVWFQLQAGDKGVRSIQSVTLGTSYGGGAISLIVAFPFEPSPVVVANVGSAKIARIEGLGHRLYNGVCLLPFGLMTSTTGVTLFGSISVAER